MKRVLYLAILVLASFVLFSGCQKSSAANQTIISADPLDTPVPRSSLPSLTKIRQVDFGNFTFPLTKDWGAPESVTLRDGRKERTNDETGFQLGEVEYGDVTGDGVEDAMLGIYPDGGGNCQCELIYIYSLSEGSPKLLWSFDTWDRAQGGFKRAYADNGSLVIELFGDDKFENGEWNFAIADGKFNGLCCPTTFTRFRFSWRDTKFVLNGKPELFDWDWRKHQTK